jgi:hypothetical protein
MDKTAAAAPGRWSWLPSWPTLISTLALTVAVATAAWVYLKHGPPSRSKYDFSSPEAALRSDLTMTRDGDFDAIRAYYRDFNRAVATEVLKTIHIERVREYKGAKLVYLSFTERGEPVRECRFYVKDAESGLWGEDRKMRNRIRDHEVTSAVVQWERE